jgi:predicted nucleic acid-binding protein
MIILFYFHFFRIVSKNEVISLRRKYSLKLPDAIIAATAITKKLTLFSGDDIFHRVKELNFIHVQ